MKNLFAAIIFGVVLAGSALAQSSTTGSIEGTVTDSTGAAKADTSITVTGTRIRRPNMTNENGAFSFADLPPGKYTISIEAANGHRRFERRNIDVTVRKVTKISIRLQKE